MAPVIPARCFCLGLSILLAIAGVARAEVYNVKVVTDASPDYSDLPSMVHSMTSNWQTPEQKCWAVFYWNHIARRQTAPMSLHGMALTDPVRQFNDYGFTMCSTVSGINQSIWEQMGLKHRYWDISNHTVSEVFYDGRWHMYDSSMSAIYALCDGKTLAGVEDIGKAGACEKSGGKEEPGHVAKYHCLTATSPRGFLTGADTMRSLDEEYRCFNPNGLKLRTYFYDWDNGHRYILNLRPGESYARYYQKVGDTPEFYVPNANGKDPETANPRYRIRGNGVWTFSPALKPRGWQEEVLVARNITAVEPAGLRPAKAGQPAEVEFKIQSANVTASQAIEAQFSRKPGAGCSIAVSTNNGLSWHEVWSVDEKDEGPNEESARLHLTDKASGAYEVLVRIRLFAPRDTSQIVLKSLRINTTTALNSKTQPRLNLGRNTVYVGAGEQTDSIVYWPELQKDGYKQHVVEEKNVASVPKHSGFRPALYPTVAKEDGYVVYRIDAPRDLTKVTFGGRFFNRAKKGHIDLLYSLDGKEWTKAWSLTDTGQPWDVIHYETAAIPAGHKSVWVKYLMNTPDPSPGGCGIYALRIEANHLPAAPGFKPLAVTFGWKERQKDRSVVERSHTQVVDKAPFRYTIDVGGDDHPEMQSLTVAHGAAGGGDAKPGYSDGKPPDGKAEKFVGVWETVGNNLAVGKPYTLSAPSETTWEAGDPDGRKLTDGIAGPPYAGGASYRYGALWKPKTNPVITLDLGAPTACASFGMNFHGYPWHDALGGNVKDKVEVLVSDDGKDYRAIGFLHTDLRWKEIPVNHMWTDEETATGAMFRLVTEKPVTTRFVQYKVTSGRTFCATELEVLDSIKLEPFDLRVALPAP